MFLLSLILLLTSTSRASIHNESIWKIMEEFNLKNPYLIRHTSWKDIKFVKKMFAKGQTGLVCRDMSNVVIKEKSAPVLFFASSEQDEEEIVETINNLGQINLPTIIISSGEKLSKVYETSKFKIDHPVYFFEEENLEIFESYVVNKQKIKRKLGYINPKTNNFIWNEYLNSNFVKRRSNFHGIILKGMVEFTGVLMNADQSYLTNAKYFSNNDTYHMNGFTFGVFNDVLKNMERQLNFSTLLYKRRDVSWGHIYSHANGSLYGTGIIGDIFDQRADLAVAPLGNIIGRALHVDYLPPLFPQYLGLYIKNMEMVEVIDLDTFKIPFTMELWMTIIGTAIIIAVIKLTILKNHRILDLQCIFDFLWTSFTGFFGARPSNSSIDSVQSYKLTIFFSLFCGIFVWAFYRSYLTAELSVITKAYPFNDLKTFSATNWRYIEKYLKKKF